MGSNIENINGMRNSPSEIPKEIEEAVTNNEYDRIKTNMGDVVYPRPHFISKVIKYAFIKKAIIIIVHLTLLKKIFAGSQKLLHAGVTIHLSQVIILNSYGIFVLKFLLHLSHLEIRFLRFSSLFIFQY